ncbi:Thiamine transporter ThiT [bioreactor metagenome]|uniref:Thiamine transporter ThiT n=1 Tax=bioreactor metagenome TaxID=1076179 RepID=A0A645CG42_9ZZZZ
MTAKRMTPTRMLCEGALLVAAAQILSFVKLFELPNGGSLTPAMFPILLFAVRWGVGSGLLAGFVLGVLQFMFDGGFALGWQSILGDYLVAFAALGLAGAFRGKRWGIFAGSVLGCLARFLVHYVVGATIWAEWMPEEFFGLTMTTPWFYSLLYNGSYMLPNLVLALVIAAALYRPMARYLTGEDFTR